MNTIKYNDFNINNISLKRDSHEYILHDNKDLSFISVTTYIAKFFEKFDSLKIATKLVNKVPKYSHMDVNELLEQWNNARDHGTQVHNEIESYLLDNNKVNEIKAVNAINWLEKHTQEQHTLYSEKIIYSEELKLAGSVDLIIKNNETNDYTIIDWKTNAKISTSSYNKKKGIHPITSNIEDCKYNLYALQLSLYRFLLEEYYGLKINRQLIVHLQDDQVLAYMTPYYENEVKQLTNLRRDIK